MYSKEVQINNNHLVDKLEYEAKMSNPRKYNKKPIERAAYLTGISRRNIFRMRNENKDGSSSQNRTSTRHKSTGRTKKLDNFDMDSSESSDSSLSESSSSSQSDSSSD